MRKDTEAYQKANKRAKNVVFVAVIQMAIAFVLWITWFILPDLIVFILEYPRETIVIGFTFSGLSTFVIGALILPNPYG